MKRSLAALLLAVVTVPATAAEPAQEVQLRSPPAQASRCITQRAQNQQHYTKTTEPRKGEQQIVVYEGPKPAETQEIGTLTLLSSGNSARVSIATRSDKGEGRDLLARLAQGC
jgi:hypothetical protein